MYLWKHFIGINLDYHFSPPAVKESYMYIYDIIIIHTYYSYFLFFSLNFLAQGQQHPTWDIAGLNTTPELVRKCLLLMIHRHLCFLSQECEFCSKCLFIIPSKDITFTFSFSIEKYMIIWRKKKWRWSFFDPISILK